MKIFEENYRFLAYKKNDTLLREQLNKKSIELGKKLGYTENITVIFDDNMNYISTDRKIKIQKID